MSSNRPSSTVWAACARMRAALVLLAATLLIGCQGGTGSVPGAGARIDLPKLVDGAGAVRQDARQENKTPVVVFEEEHSSRGSQMEIALMLLLRLYRDYGLR